MSCIDKVELPSSWTNYFSGTKEEMQAAAGHLTKDTRDIFHAYYTSDQFASLGHYDRIRVTSIDKNLTQFIEELGSFYTPGRDNFVEISQNIVEECSYVAPYIEAVKTLNQAFFGLLSEDVGNDLDVDGWLNTRATKAKELIFDLFTAVLIDSMKVRMEKLDFEFPDIAAIDAANRLES